MDEGLKNRILLVLGITSVVFCFGTISSCNSALRQKAMRDSEMSKRLELEEKMTKFSQERSILEEKLKAKTKELEVEQNITAQAKETLVQEQLISQDLKEKLDTVSKSKEAPGVESKETLPAGKRSKK